MMLTRDLPDPAATTAFAQRLAALLFPGAVVALIGTLGAGKTYLVRAIGEALGVGAIVNSPTFVLIQEYEGRLPIYHFDVYRLQKPAEFFELGVHEYFEGEGVCLVEWADRVAASLPADHLRVSIEVTGPTSRRLTVESTGPKHGEIARQLETV